MTCTATFPYPVCWIVPEPVEGGSSCQVDVLHSSEVFTNSELGVPMEQRLFLLTVHGPHPIPVCAQKKTKTCFL